MLLAVAATTRSALRSLTPVRSSALASSWESTIRDPRRARRFGELASVGPAVAAAPPRDGLDAAEEEEEEEDASTARSNICDDQASRDRFSAATVISRR